MKKALILLVVLSVVVAGCASLSDKKAQTGLADYVTGDTQTAAKLNAIKNTADTADALASVNEAKLAAIEALTDGGVLLGSGTGTPTAMAVLADGEMIVGDGTTDPVAESGATLRTSIGVGTTDSPQFTGIELGHATANTLTASGGVLSIEGDAVLRTSDTTIYEAVDAAIMRTDNVSEIAGLTEDETPDSGDFVVTELATTGAKRKVALSNLNIGNMSTSTYDVDSDGKIDWDKMDFTVPITPAEDSINGGIQFDTAVAGAALAAFKLVYKKTGKYYLYDADGADIATYPLPIAMTSSAAAAADANVTLVTGVFMLRATIYDSTTNADDGKPVYASDTAGSISVTPPATAGDKKIIVGIKWGSDRVLMSLPATVNVEIPAAP